MYSAVALLTNLGYEISTYEENGIGYYLKGRTFDPSEIHLLMDAVCSFSFLPARHSQELMKKLQKQLSVYQRRQHRPLTIVQDEKKTDNRQVFWNIEQLDEAVSAKKQVRFTYMEYGMDKKLHPRREKPYIVNPYGMVYMNEYYYLNCSLAKYTSASIGFNDVL